MARYNHFGKPKHKRISFSELPIGKEFSMRDRPFRACTKTGILKYFINKTEELIELHGTAGLLIYIK